MRLSLNHQSTWHYFWTPFFIILCIVASGVFSSSPATYFVDATNGSDSNDGLSSSSAWKTIAKVNSSSFSPGDNILFKKGEVWRGKLVTPSSGAVGSPITFSSYGSGPNPLIKRTELFNAWTEYSLIKDGSLEQYTIGTPDDNWGSFSEFPGPFGTASVKADTTLFHSGIASAKLSAVGNGIAFGSGDYAALTPYANSVQNNTAYRLSLWGRVGVAGDNALVLRVVDTDNGKYLDSNGNWQSSNITVAANWNGSPVDTWIKKDISFISAATGSGNYQIKLYNFQNGSAWVDDFYLNADSIGSTKIWSGYEPSTGMHLGAIQGGVRLPIYPDVGAQDPLTMAAGIFNSFSDGFFFYRNDAGSPGEVELGVRDYSFVVDNKSHIVIDGIDQYGPGGHGSTWDSSLINILGTSSDVVVKNLTVSFGDGFGIHSASTTSNLIYDNIDSHDNGSTGIYMNSMGGTVKNSKAHDNGRVSTDMGDRGGIGSYQGNNITITNNEVYRNSQDDSGGDFEISVVGVNSPFLITNNYVHDCIQGCFQIAEGGNNSIIANNIINRFGTTSVDPNIGSVGKHGAIRIGGGNGGATGVQILNNVIYGGVMSTAVNHGSISVGKFDDSNMVVKNNIFLQNVNKDIYVQDKATTTGFVFDRNVYFKSDLTNNWQWKGVNYSTLSAWQGATSLDLSSFVANPLMVNASGNYSQKTDFQLSATSPFIDAGAVTGLTTDHAGNPIYGAPDIGPYEYQPPYTIGVHRISPGGAIRVYADGKYRYTTVTLNAATADLLVAPVGGFGTGNYSEFMNLAVSTWQMNAPYMKEWTASSSLAVNTVYTVGDLASNANYKISIDGSQYGILSTDVGGHLNFTYGGGYATHMFKVEQSASTVTVVPPQTSTGIAVPAEVAAPSVATTTAATTSQIIATTTPLTTASTTQQAVTEQKRVPALVLMRTLKKGLRGSDVSALQELLKTDPTIYPEGSVTGYYGVLTVAAVQRFQTKYSIGHYATPGYGGVGPLTLAKLNEVYASTGPAVSQKLLLTTQMSFGAKGEQVTALQSGLATDPSIYPEGMVTGYYGSATKAAVGRFQEKYQLGTPSTPGYGGVGPLTLAKFNEVYRGTK